MINTIEGLTHVQQNHSGEFLFVHASQDGICRADECRFCGMRFLISTLFRRDGCLMLSMPSSDSTRFSHTPLTRRLVYYYRVMRNERKCDGIF